jgi:hypothetical protein
MPDELSADDQSLIERALKSMRNPNRKVIPSDKVKLFLLMVGDELKRTGELKRDFVEGLLSQIKAGAL